jgi:hypothetical protein
MKCGFQNEIKNTVVKYRILHDLGVEIFNILKCLEIYRPPLLSSAIIHNLKFQLLIGTTWEGAINDSCTEKQVEDDNDYGLYCMYVWYFFVQNGELG